MRKTFLSIASVWFIALTCSAQIQVTSDGSVGIGGYIDPYNKITIVADSTHKVGIHSFIENTNENLQIAMYGDALNSNSLNTGRTYGIYGIAGNRTSGYNYGVYGEIGGNNHGAGIFGTNTDIVPQINGKYAGYFYGNTYITGTLIVGHVTSVSDARYKSNIQQINSSALSKIATLNPVQYTMLSGDAIAFANTEQSDTCSMTMTTSNEDLHNANKIHYGLLAQEVKELYPELVHEDAAGVMSINYIELIPLLIHAVQDLSEQVSMLTSVSTRKLVSKQPNSNTETVGATLYQNNPNPFTEKTIISYIVPNEAQQASIYLYDMTGVQLHKYDISVYGEGEITISANELYAGTFLYSLVVDGKLIDTKQMIITQ